MIIRTWLEVWLSLTCLLLCLVFGTRGQFLGAVMAILGALAQAPPLVILGGLMAWFFERLEVKR